MAAGQQKMSDKAAASLATSTGVAGPGLGGNRIAVSVVRSSTAGPGAKAWTGLGIGLPSL